MSRPLREVSSPLRQLLATLVFALTLVLTGTACQEPGIQDSTLFERAEERLQRGDYEGARQDYQRFLSEHPTGPFSGLAEQRLLNIERELASVMGRRATPAPIYIRPAQSREEESAPNGDR